MQQAPKQGLRVGAVSEVRGKGHHDVRNRPLTPVQLLEEVPEIVKLLASNGIDNLVVEYGWGVQAGSLANCGRT